MQTESIHMQLACIRADTTALRICDSVTIRYDPSHARFTYSNSSAGGVV